MFHIGPYTIDSQVILAPMAGVTDRPFRQLCKRMGAGLVVSEMVTSDTRLWKSRKSAYRLNHTGEVEPRSIQIAGGDPDMMADAAIMNVQRGAQIIDINMGCPAKKVCNKAAGSALLKDEQLVSDILNAVTSAVDIPVTLKIRTGWDTENKNALTIARIAEEAGIQALAVHGRTRSCGYRGEAEYDTIASINEAVSIPVFANGDITSPEKALKVLQHTGCSAVMIGRAAQGKPWLFREIDHYLRTGTILPPPKLEEIRDILLGHLQELHDFYGEYLGVRIARKHVGWYLQDNANGSSFRKQFNIIETAADQAASIEDYFDSALNNGVAA
ncbi:MULTISPECIES: tRNA dihydrouridine synthase DusB [unclassified Neptuniibacter]|jgi:tRNA-dihydrouridine synthase B|uniref:tRNA dihydrouridine synthase DusB n=1 Tax=unclassified Neptuniibacter TaxID=2630693 RepID=UPI0026E184DD|nr:MULTISPECIES: tRNA dihydrouridine synthase DusB [unclassified Neptuniibacter]MDO6512697.1 tRNA dihydrouridine synthase DusB [Neptuniibacter sp. 2_MG-2023]MDO6593455.1 tRNA dihydrouridine synthase DusB [Neptuniibacter sp. 1_MG-2023]